jgi:hypothetical protein
VVTFQRVQDFWNKHDRVPLQPDELPNRAGRDNSMLDGWGRKLIWESDGKNAVVISTLGRDGEVGGVDEDADKEVAFVGIKKGQDEIAKINLRNTAN